MWVPDSYPKFFSKSVFSSWRYSNSKVVPCEKDRDKDTDRDRDNEGIETDTDTDTDRTWTRTGKG